MRVKNEFQATSELKWIPDGFHFIGPEESEIRRRTLERVHAFFREKGFLEVKPPCFDFTSSFHYSVPESEQAKILKTRDLQGTEISPSLDLTLQVVKGMTGFTSKKGSSK